MSADKQPTAPGEPEDRGTGWLERPATVNGIVYLIYLVCAGLAIGDLFYEKHPHFAFEGWFAFFPVYGLVACVFLVLSAKKLRTVLMRSEDYYDPAPSEPDGGEDHA